MEIVNRNRVQAFVTKDASEIREILAPRNSAIQRQSLAEATLHPGQASVEHCHPRTEEIYYILQGTGRIKVGEEAREVLPGDGIAIPPGQRHRIRNTGKEDLVFLCCCVPAYEHEDTVLTPDP